MRNVIFGKRNKRMSKKFPRLVCFLINSKLLTPNLGGYRQKIFKRMKKIIFMMSLFLLSGSAVSYAQLTKEQQKERKEISKLSRDELSQKAGKEARKEAKRLKKEGWSNAPGALPMEKQLDKSYMMQMEYDRDMLPKWIMGEAMSVGESYDAAKIQALELAKQNLVSQIQTEVTALIENNVANKQFGEEEAASVVQTVSTGKALISQSVGRTLTVVEIFRTLPNKRKEVMVRMAYSSDMAKEAAKKAIRAELEKKGDDLSNKLDQMLGW